MCCPYFIKMIKHKFSIFNFKYSIITVLFVLIFSALSYAGFTDNGDGTVIDNSTGFAWSQDANLPGGVLTWQAALDYVTALNSNAYLGYTDWSLPSKDELKGLISGWTGSSPASWLSNQGFTNVQVNFYWSSTSDDFILGYAWFIDLSSGIMISHTQTSDSYIWPVRLSSGGNSDISVSPASNDFGNVAVGDTSTAQSFTVSNNGGADLVINTISLTGTDAALFSIQNDSCSGLTVAASGSCTVDVVFSPTAEAAASANLSIPSDGPDTPTLDVTLSGTGSCTYSISPTSNFFGLNSGTGSVSVTATSGCNWTATSSDTFWLTISSGSSGTGDGTVGYSVTANTGSSTRTGAITIAGQTFTVTQTGTGTGTCTYSISPTSNSFDLNSGTGSVSVTTTSGCSWTATSNDTSWLTISSGSSGTDDGTVGYSITANTGSSTRTGTMTIAGETFTVTQTAICTYSISPTSNSFNMNSGTDSVRVTAISGCSWTATSNDTSWLTISSGSSGTGDGTVDYSVTANIGTSTRAGTLTIAGETFTVTQTADTCTYSISPTRRSFNLNSGTGRVSVTATSGCGWTATSNDTSWLTISSGGSGTGDGTVGYFVTANTGTSTRSGTLTIAGETFTVTQTADTCTYSISPTSNSVGPSRVTGSVSVTAVSGCIWDAVSNDSWITIVSGSSGDGDGTVNYSVSENTSTSISIGTLTIAGETFTVTQAAQTATDVPTNFSYSAVECTTVFSTTCTMTLKWDAMSGVSGYKLYYGYSSGDYIGSLDMGDATSVSFEGISEGTYYLALTAYDSSGNETDKSDELVAIISGSLSTPTDFSATTSDCTDFPGSTCTINLSWSYVSVSSGYNLYYGYSSGDYIGSLDMGDATSVSFEGISEGTYYLALTAYGSDGEESDYSEEVGLVVGESSVPTDFTYSTSDCVEVLGSTTCTISLSWTGVSGFSGYYLYYGTSSGDYIGLLDMGVTTSVSFEGISEGTYYLALTAYDSYMVESGYSEEVVLEVK